MSWLIDRIEDSCRLTLIRDQLPDNARTAQLAGGWPMVLSGLKTLLETGEMLTNPASIQYFVSTRAYHEFNPAINPSINSTDGAPIT